MRGSDGKRMRADNYISRKRQWLKSFDWAINRGKRVLIDHEGVERANALVSEARREYEALIPRIPFIGHRCPFLVFLLPASRYLAVYRVLQINKISIEEAGQIICRMNESEWNVLPIPLRRMISYVWFTPLFINRLRKRAKETQERKYPGGYVLTFIEGDGRSFDYGLDYTECAACKFLNREGAPKLAPLICSFDKSASEMLGWGLTRTTTIANGDQKCNFRFKKGGKTNITA